MGKMMFLYLLVAAASTSVVFAVNYPTNVSVTIVCHELSVAASWNKTDFAGGNVTRVEWNDASCNTVDETDTQVSATINFSSCKSVITQYNDTIMQENTAKVYVSYEVDIIQRVIIYSFKTRCSMVRSIHTGAVSYNVTEKHIVGGNATSVAEFNVRMDIYTDATFANVMVNTIVSSFDPLHIAIHEINDNELLRFVTHDCFATRTADRNGPSYKFFDDRCPSDKSFKFIPSSADRYQFQINAFRFIQLSQSVYIHCKLSVCKTNSTSDKCKQDKNCATKRKRRAIADFSQEDPVEEITVMSEKLTFLKPTCSEMSCPQFASCIELDRLPACRCGHGYVFIPTRNECSNERTFTISGLHLQYQFEEEFKDPYSREFIKLATRIESQLNYFLSRLNDGAIEGIKVLRAREGSVIVDVDVIYAPTSTKEEAYSTFLKSISKSHTESVEYVDALIIKDKTPILSEIISGSSDTVLILSVVVPLVFVLTVVSVVVFAVKRRNESKE